VRSVRDPPVIARGGVCHRAADSFESEILLLYMSSTRRKKLAVKPVPVIGEACATELLILSNLRFDCSCSQHLIALGKLHVTYIAHMFCCSSLK
jgi:GTP cyclohydrolase I